MSGLLVGQQRICARPSMERLRRRHCGRLHEVRGDDAVQGIPSCHRCRPFPALSLVFQRLMPGAVLSGGPASACVLPDNVVRPVTAAASSWLDLAEDRLRLDRLRRNGVPRLSSPGLPPRAQAPEGPGSPIPREARKQALAERGSPCRHPTLRYGPLGASSIVLGP